MNLAVIKINHETGRCVFASPDMSPENARKLYEKLGGEEKGYELTSSDAALVLMEEMTRPRR